MLNCTVTSSYRKFIDEVSNALVCLREHGVNVLSPKSTRVIDSIGDFVILEGDHGSAAELQLKHLSCIRQSDFLYVVNPNGYVGPSAAMEIGYAISHEIPVFCSHQPSEDVFSNFVRIEYSISDIVEWLQKQVKDLPEPGSDLTKLQSYVKRVSDLRGFGEETLRDKVLLLIEEVGELAKAIRRSSGIKYDPASKGATKEVSSEIADCLIYLLDISNKASVNLEAALISKEAVNWGKHWKSDKPKF